MNKIGLVRLQGSTSLPKTNLPKTNLGQNYYELMTDLAERTAAAVASSSGLSAASKEHSTHSMPYRTSTFPCCNPCDSTPCIQINSTSGEKQCDTRPEQVAGGSSCPAESMELLHREHRV